MHISFDSSQVPFGTRHSLPVTQTQGIVQRSQDEFPARCGVKLCANRLLSKVFCDHLSRQRVEGVFYKLRDKERSKESAYVFNLIFRIPLKDEADGMHLYREKRFVFPSKQREPPHLPKTFSTPNALFRF